MQEKLNIKLNILGTLIWQDALKNLFRGVDELCNSISR